MKRARVVDVSTLPVALSVPEAGAVLGLGRDAAYEAVRRGELRAVRIGRRLIVPRAAVLALLDEPSAARAAG